MPGAQTNGKSRLCVPSGRTYTVLPINSGEVRQSQGWLAVARRQLDTDEALQALTLSVVSVEQLAGMQRMPPSLAGHASRQTSHIAAGTQWPGGAGST
eukprot:scaffold38998_cov74-Phaeocystis_antarctica.AAC.3